VRIIIFQLLSLEYIKK